MTTKIILAVLIGGVAGGFLGYKLQCIGGTCPLTCNPAGGVITGIIFGLMFVLN
jgi:hypothetical protein